LAKSTSYKAPDYEIIRNARTILVGYHEGNICFESVAERMILKWISEKQNVMANLILWAYLSKKGAWFPECGTEISGISWP
jgi:hypothetical protein